MTKKQLDRIWTSHQRTPLASACKSKEKNRISFWEVLKRRKTYNECYCVYKEVLGICQLDNNSPVPIPNVHNVCTWFVIYILGFCGSDPSGIKVTTKTAKSIHVVWDTTQTNCGYTITGYKVFFNCLSPFKNYKEKTVSGATTDTVDIFPIFPGFSYNIFVKHL